MKQKVFKYTLEITGNQRILLPIGYKILTIKMQNLTACMWCLVDEEVEKEVVHFEIFGTGQPIHSGMGVSSEYIGTFYEDCGLVWHLFKYTGV